MKRTEVYAQIKSMHLEEVIKKYYGKNYTNVDTPSLLSVINAQTMKFTPKKTGRFDKLIEVLQKKHILLQSEVDYINQ